MNILKNRGKKIENSPDVKNLRTRNIADGPIETDLLNQLIIISDLEKD